MESDENKEDQQKGFGTFKGVYLPSILTILGVIMYLRMGWVAGNVGLWGALLIVTMANIITFLTGLSIAATATNMKVKGGGAYFMISRSFGVEAGAAVGIPLFFAQSIGTSFYIVGFAESVNSLFPGAPLIMIGIISLIILTILAYISADIALKTQMFIFIIIAASLVSLFMGGTPERGFNTAAAQTHDYAPFWIVFAVFFPAVTGILSGVSMSGDLKNPARALPLGTLAAIATGYIIYMAVPIFLYRTVPREILISDSMIMKEIAFMGELIVLGIWGATLSSAIGSLLGAPRTLQALARDQVVPRFLGVGAGDSDTPRIATAISFAVALIAILLGDLNALAPVLTMFFLTSYGTLNLIAGIEGLIANPSWRPTFKTPWPFSLLGAAFCFAAMLMINAGATFIAAFVVISIFYLMSKRNLNARWPDVRRSILLALARYSIFRLEDSGADARSWKPNILVLSGAPTQRFYLIELADAITHGKSFLTVLSIVSQAEFSEERIENMEKSVREFLRKRHIPALVKISLADNVYPGAREVVKNYGIGPLTPNTFLLGETEHRENYEEFAELIRLIHQSRRNLIIVREGDAEKEKESAVKNICVWWGGERENAGLMLALAYMLQISPEWKNSKLQLKMIVRRDEDRQSALEQANRYVTEGRLTVDVEILVGQPGGSLVSTTIRDFSEGADLVFLGMRPPGPDEPVGEYAAYYEELIKSTEGFPPSALVLASEDIKFSKIFI